MPVMYKISNGIYIRDQPNVLVAMNEARKSKKQFVKRLYDAVGHPGPYHDDIPGDVQVSSLTDSVLLAIHLCVMR